MFVQPLSPFSNLFLGRSGRFGVVLSTVLRTFSAAKKDPSKGFRGCIVTDCMVDPCTPEPSVVIVGAGIAGLSVAQRLSQCGLSNFVVLEATDRPGGRIHSCWFGDVVAEMGAQHIHGACVNNPVFTLAAQEGLLKPPLKRTNSSKGIYLTSDGRAADHTTAMVAHHVFDQIQREALSLFAMRRGKEHGSLFDFFSLRIQQELQNFPEDQRYKVCRILYGLTHRIRMKVGEDLSKVSADNYGSFIGLPGGNVQIPLGFVGVLSPLLKELTSCNVKFNKPVELIRWDTVREKKDGSPRAIVQCCDGEEYCADYVVITVSLGVLKEHAEEMFFPLLPANKMDAIQNLGYGNINKVYLDYDKPFWVWSEGGMKFAWSPDELIHGSNWTKGLVSVEEVVNSKHVLCAFICGPESIVVEHCSDEEVANGLYRYFTNVNTLRKA
ncbi:peroxisomal N(1)-acetyl-spermine/spermidine oxidase isoform X2 [Euwallacea fornicatus]|uniref:peroxisomal N(1)-acetyl-spermine/spermidine oxidase isoform X2 n=1 Tax=Euwallacea fornicatus TaxID=995702 RepID=UPI00338D98E5